MMKALTQRSNEVKSGDEEDSGKDSWEESEKEKSSLGAMNPS